MNSTLLHQTNQEHQKLLKSPTKNANSCCQVHLQAVCFQPFGSNVISWVQLLQPPPAWTVGTYRQYVTSLAFATMACQLLQGPTSFIRMHSCLGWSRSNSECPAASR